MDMRDLRIGLAAAAATLLAACATTPAMQDAAPPSHLGPVSEIDAPPTPEELAAPTQVVILGTGTPIPDTERAGAGVAVIYKGEAYVFDLGAGVVRRALEARKAHDIPSLYPSSICCVFFTHLHSDHIVDYPELLGTLWWRRVQPLRVWGPAGTARMTDGVEAMMGVDYDLRIDSGAPIAHPEFHEAQVTEIEPGIVFEGDGISIEAFPVNHGSVKPAFGYKIVTDDRTIVISGDTSYSETLIKKATGADILVHEVASEAGVSAQSEQWQDYHRSSHSTTSVIAEIGQRAHPKKIVLYHALFYDQPEDSIVEEIRQGYDGDVVLANDLDVY
jgi:ribonuclease Z